MKTSTKIEKVDKLLWALNRLTSEDKIVLKEIDKLRDHLSEKKKALLFNNKRLNYL